MIGVSNRGAANLAGVAHENVVALCDVDPDNAKKAREQFPKAEFFTDYRQLFDKAAKSFDAVVVSTPDHNHALPACIAMALGKHVYCEKPMAETVNEVRHMRALAAKHKVVTQMGTQIHAGNNYRRVVEIVQAGLLGDVTGVRVWNNSKPVGGKKLATKPSAKFDLDLWMGPTTGEFFEAEMNKSGWNYAWPHFHWRWWWEFGGGMLADFGCHYMDLPYWALRLTSPASAEATGKKTYEGDNTTPDVMGVAYRFPATKGARRHHSDVGTRRRRAGPRQGRLQGLRRRHSVRRHQGRTRCGLRQVHDSPGRFRKGLQGARLRASSRRWATTRSGPKRARATARYCATSTIPAASRKPCCLGMWPTARRRS